MKLAGFRWRKDKVSSLGTDPPLVAFSEKQIRVAQRKKEIGPENNATSSKRFFRYCPQCDAMLNDQAGSCSSCGWGLSRRLVMVPKPEKESRRPPQYATHPCPECGEEMLDSQANCTECGYFEGETTYGPGGELRSSQPSIKARKQTKAKQQAQGWLLLLVFICGFWVARC